MYDRPGRVSSERRVRSALEQKISNGEMLNGAKQPGRSGKSL